MIRLGERAHTGRKIETVLFRAFARNKAVFFRAAAAEGSIQGRKKILDALPVASGKDDVVVADRIFQKIVRLAFRVQEHLCTAQIGLVRVVEQGRLENAAAGQIAREFEYRYCARG